MMNVHGKFKSSLLPVMLVMFALLSVAAWAIINVGGTGNIVHAIDTGHNITNISIVGKAHNGNNNAGLNINGFNVSGTMIFNITMNATNGSASGSEQRSWNITNVSLMFILLENGSIMGNFTLSNNTGGVGFGGNIFSASNNNSPQYWNISVDTTTLPDGVYTLRAMVSNYSHDVATAAAQQPRHNATLAINISVDNSAPNVSIATVNGNSGLNITLSSVNGNGNAGDNMTGFNISANDPTFYKFSGAGAITGTNLANITFSFDNASTTGFNITVGNGGAPIGTPGANTQANFTAVNFTNATFNVSVNLSALHAGEHRVRIFAYNHHGKLNNSVLLNFTLNTPHNVTIHSSPTGNVVTQFANFSGGNLSMMFNISIVNATLSTSGFPSVPIWSVILMFDNASGNDFNYTNQSRTGMQSGNNGSNTSYSPVNSFRNTASTNGGWYYNISYNVSALAEGNHTVTVFVNDTLGNHNKTTKISFVVDKTAPGLTISCSPSSPKEGETVSCTCSAEDGLSGIKENAKFLGAAGASESTVAMGIGSKDTSICSAVDYAGNRNEKKGSYEVVSAASGGSGGGGSGGGTTSSVGTSGTKKVWASVNAGETATIAVNKEGLAVTAVEVKVDKTVYGAWVIVKSVEKADLPSAASKQLAGKVYDLIEISENKNALKEGTVSERSVAFKVEKSWLSQNGVEKNDVALLRFADNAWAALSTSVTKEDDKAVEYKATVPGFSYFAIGEKSMATAAPLVEEEQPTAAEPSAPSAPAPATKAAPSEGRSLTWLWIVLVLVVVGAVVYFVQKRK